MQGIKKEGDNPNPVTQRCIMYAAKILLVCSLLVSVEELSANVITDLVKSTKESVEQLLGDIAASELVVACDHTGEYFCQWLADRPVQSGVASGIIAFLFCYWMSQRATKYRSICEQTDAYNNGFEDGYTYAFHIIESE